MIRFTRKATIRNGAILPKAMGWAAEFNNFVNDKYKVDLRYGVEMFGATNLTWFVDFNNLGEAEAFNQQLMVDQDYWAWVAKAADFWVDGSLQDTVVNVM